MNSGHSNGIKVVGYFDGYGGGQVVVRERIAYVGHIAPPHGTSIIDVSDPSRPRELATISVPEGTLSHKVRVENGVMLVNREIFPIGRKDPNFRGGLEVYDVSRPADPRRIASFSCRGMHRFTLRWPLRLRLAGNGWLSRQHRRHHRLPGSGAPGARQQVVDAGAVVSRRGKADVGGHGASLSSSHPPRRSALRQLLAWRVRDSRHRGSEQAEIRFRPRLVAAISLADPYRAAGAVCAARPPRDASRRRRRRAARPGLPVVPVDRRHHRRNAPDSVRELSSRGGRRLAETGLHRLAPVL